MSRISSMDRLDSLKFAMLPYIPIGNIVFDEVLLYIQVRWWLSNMSIWLQSIVMQNHSFPKCGGVLFIAYNWILAHMKKALTKFTLLFILEVLTFFFHLLAFVWTLVVDIYVAWRIVDKTNERMYGDNNTMGDKCCGNDGTMYIVGGRKNIWQGWFNFDDVHRCYNGDCDIISFHWLSL